METTRVLINKGRKQIYKKEDADMPEFDKNFFHR